MSMSRMRALVTGVPVARPGRPRSFSPLDQKITIAVTNREKTLAQIDLQQSESSSMSNLIRSRGLESVDLVAWTDAATTALDKLDVNVIERLSLRRETSQVNRERDKAYALGDAETVRACDDMLVELEEKRGALSPAWAERRVDRLVGRFAFEDREEVAWKAEKLGISLSDFVRMQLFGYVPGFADHHMSASSRKAFYLAVIRVAQEGWGTRPSTEVCRHCRSPLPSPVRRS